MAKFTPAVEGGGGPDTTMVAADRVPDMVAMDGLVDMTAHVDGGPEEGDFPEAASRAAISMARSTACPPSRSWTGGITGPTGSTKPARRRRRRMTTSTTAKTLTDPTKGRWGFGMRGGAGGQKYVLDILAFGAPIIDDEGNIALDRNKTTEAVDCYTRLFTTEKVVPPSATNDGYRQIMEAFRTGQTGDGVAPHRFPGRNPG